MIDRAGVVARGSALARACHPLPTLVVTVLVGALAAAWGRGVGGTAVVVAAVFAGQLSVGWCNDAVDAERDEHAGRRDKPLVTGDLPRRTVARAAAASLLACLPLSFASGLVAGVVHLVGVAAAWLYDLGLKATPWSWAPYAVGFAALPAFVVLGLPGAPRPAWWLVTAGALLGVGAHAANTLPDFADDAATGVRGLPHRLGPAGARLVCVAALLGTVVLLVVAPPGPPSALSLAALAVVGALALLGVRPGLAPRDRAPFHAAVAAAVCAVGLLLTMPAPLT